MISKHCINISIATEYSIFAVQLLPNCAKLGYSAEFRKFRSYSVFYFAGKEPTKPISWAALCATGRPVVKPQATVNLQLKPDQLRTATSNLAPLPQWLVAALSMMRICMKCYHICKRSVRLCLL